MTRLLLQRTKRALAALGLMSLTAVSVAGDPLLDGQGHPWGGRDAMNGYAFKDYKDFWSKWHLVTARYRTDNGEIRVTYANDIAWATIQAGRTDFPDGAKFGKIAYRAVPDPLFTSSLAPGAVHRYQLMVKDSKKYPDSRGWGYAIFNGQGKTLPESPVTTSKACANCHEYAAPRGYVFLGAMHPGPKALPTEQLITSTSEADVATLARAMQDYVSTDSASLSALKKVLPTGLGTVMVASGKAVETLFSGTLSEYKPSLIRNALRTGLPHAVVSADQARWALVTPTTAKPETCESHGRRGIRLAWFETDAHLQTVKNETWCDISAVETTAGSDSLLKPAALPAAPPAARASEERTGHLQWKSVLIGAALATALALLVSFFSRRR